MNKHTDIYINLPVKNLPQSRAFFERMGYAFNPEMSNDDGACLMLGGNLFAMLLTEPFFQKFTDKPIGDARKMTAAIICVSCDSRAEVDALVDKAVAAGGTAPRPPVDHGFMYQHGYHDLDGHVWEFVAMATQSNLS